MVDIYTDGACSGNPGPGGWAWVADDGRTGVGAEPDTTNQRMELTAVLRAVADNDGALHIHSDSTYVVNAFRDRWFDGWLKRGWTNTQKKPVANRDLWEPLVAAYLDREHEIQFTWVKGHAGNAGNEEADRLAVAALDVLKAEQRDALSAEPSSGASGGDGSIVAPWPADQAIVVTGGRDFGPDALEELTDAISTLDADNDVVVSGLRLGAELVGAEVAIKAGIPLGVALPFDDPARRWPAPERRRFDAAVAAAQWVVTLNGDPSKPGVAIRDRNEWFWTVAVGAIVVADSALADTAEHAGLGVIAI
ncbi:MAG: ribonuclease H [Actinomycetota bacterium]